MAIYQCSICGAIFDEEKEGRKLEELTECPVCKHPISKFERIDSGQKTETAAELKEALWECSEYLYCNLFLLEAIFQSLRRCQLS